MRSMHYILTIQFFLRKVARAAGGCCLGPLSDVSSIRLFQTNKAIQFLHQLFLTSVQLIFWHSVESSIPIELSNQPAHNQVQI